MTTPADTNQTASTEAIGANFTAGTRTWAGGTLTLQRERVFAAPTYAFAGASTLTTAVNVDIANPVAGTNATITNAWALRVANTNVTGNLKVDGNVVSNLIFTDNTYDIGASGATRPRNLYLAGLLTMGGALTVSGAVTMSATTDNLALGTSQTSGTWTAGGASQTGTLTLDQSTKTHTLNIGSGATESAATKTINIGTGGVSTSTTSITIGSTNGTTVNVNGAAVFSAGTAAAPAITTTGDTNTGIFFPAADTIAFTEGGTESMRIDSSGNVGIGTSSPGAKLDVQGTGTQTLRVQTNTSGNPTLNLSAAGADSASLLFDRAGNALRFDISAITGAMYLNTAGNLGLGVTPSAWISTFRALQIGGRASFYSDSGASTLVGNNTYNDGQNRYIANAAAALYLQFSGQHQWYNAPSGTAGNAISFTQAMTLDASGNLGVGVTNPSAYGARFVSKGTTSGIFTDDTNYTFAIKSGGSGVSVIGGEAGNALAFQSGGSERARIDTSGNFLVGTTTASGGASSGGINTPNGYGINRNLTDQAGRRNWATVTESSNVGDFVFLCSTTNTGNPNTVRFQIRSDGSCFNSTGTYGTLSDIKLKENVTDATPKLNSLLQVRVVNYNRIGEDRKELGVIAQELEQIFPGMVDEQEDLVDGQPAGTTTKSVKYSVFVPMLVKAIQEQQAIITALTVRVAALESNP